MATAKKHKLRSKRSYIRKNSERNVGFQILRKNASK